MNTRAEKLSISLPAQSVQFVERYRKAHALKSRSQVIEQALRLLRERELEADYRDAASDESDFKDFDTAIAHGSDDEA